MEWAWWAEKLVGGALLLGSAFLGVYLKGWYDLKFKKIDEAEKIRLELRGELANLRRFRERYEIQRSLITDYDIALSRTLARMEETVECINNLLEAEQLLDKGHVRRARVILSLIESDRRARETMRLEERATEKWEDGHNAKH